MRPLPKLLSKTKIMRGYRCLKALYLTIQNPELEPPVTPDMQALFDQGNRIGELARAYYPGGELVDFPAWEFVNSLKRTRELIAAGTPLIYEAAFEYKGCYARADIIQFAADTGRWTILEAKSSTKVKDEHIDDVGLQAWIIANSGLKIEKIGVLHLNPECRFPDLKNLFIESDVTEILREKYPLTGPRLNEIFNALRQPRPPVTDIGEHCHKGRDCEFVTHCYAEKNLPEISVLDVYVLKNAWDLYRQGVIELKDLDTSEFTEIQKRMVIAHLENRRIVETEKLKAGLADWKFPLVFLDFETLGDAVPRFRGAGPYSEIPFQFSAHVLDDIGGTARHFEFLFAGGDGDPREELIEALLRACGEEGSIVAYNAKFEIKVIGKLAQDFPLHEERLRALIPRFQDPLPLIRETVYDPAFKGGFGLKAVAPALLGGKYSYSGMAVPDGKAAQRAYYEMNAAATPPARREELRRALLQYCEQDTLACVDLARWMFEQA